MKAMRIRMCYIFDDDNGTPSIADNKKDAHVLQHTTTSGSSGRGVSEDARTQAAHRPARPGQKRGLSSVRMAVSWRVAASRANESGTGRGTREVGHGHLWSRSQSQRATSSASSDRGGRDRQGEKEQGVRWERMKL